MLIRYRYLILGHLYKLISPTIHSTHKHASIGIMHMINGLILDRVAFDTFSLEYQDIFVNPSWTSNSELCNNIMHAIRMKLGPLA